MASTSIASFVGPANHYFPSQRPPIHTFHPFDSLAMRVFAHLYLAYPAKNVANSNWQLDENHHSKPPVRRSGPHLDWEIFFRPLILPSLKNLTPSDAQTWDQEALKLLNARSACRHESLCLGHYRNATHDIHSLLKVLPTLKNLLPLVRNPSFRLSGGWSEGNTSHGRKSGVYC
jgi:hypothetical protein